MNRRNFLQSSVAAAPGLLLGPPPVLAGPEAADVIVYGGTAAGVVAAVAAARRGARVTLLEPGTHLGGMVSGGLGHTDWGRKETIGGISLEFFQRVGRYYGQPITWDFEPHVAEYVFTQMAGEARVDVLYRRRLKELAGVLKRGLRISELVAEDGGSFHAPVSGPQRWRCAKARLRRLTGNLDQG
jgi:NADPH-dependent 2,4-dienoyl-CoA reductase/sulfur reductase-like enzyme